MAGILSVLRTQGHGVLVVVIDGPTVPAFANCMRDSTVTFQRRPCRVGCGTEWLAAYRHTRQPTCHCWTNSGRTSERDRAIRHRHVLRSYEESRSFEVLALDLDDDAIVSLVEQWHLRYTHQTLECFWLDGDLGAPPTVGLDDVDGFPDGADCVQRDDIKTKLDADGIKDKGLSSRVELTLQP